MEECKQLQLLGVSFRNAPLAVREALTFGPSETVNLLRAAKEEMPDVEGTWEIWMSPAAKVTGVDSKSRVPRSTSAK